MGWTPWSLQGSGKSLLELIPGFGLHLKVQQSFT